MTLSSLVRGKQTKPLRLLIFGVEGIGKSSFAAGAPNPIFIEVEDGTSQLDIVRFPRPESWTEVLEAIETLTKDVHNHQTLVLDSLDRAEQLLWDHICKRDGEPNIEAYGYGKGYSAALDEWRLFISALERLQRAKPMHVVLIGHSTTKTFKNPEGDDFDRYELKLHVKASGFLREWCDAVLFANYETFVQKEKNKRVKGVDTGARLIFTQRRAAYDAKNRFALPDFLHLSWAEFESAVKAAQPADPAALASEIERKSKILGGKLEADAIAAIKRANGDATKLAQLNDWCNAQIGKKGQEQ